MFELITESNRADYYKRLYIDEDLLKKQRLIDAVVFALLGLLFGVGIWMLTKSLIIGGISIVIFAVLFGYGGYKRRYVMIRNQAAQQTNKISMMFPEFLQTFIALMDANPTASIVTILESSVPYLKAPIKQEVMKLVKAIYTDGRDNNVRNAMRVFAQYMNTDEALRIMMLVFSMYEEGSNPAMLRELEDKIDELNKNKVETYISKKGSGLNGKSFPALVCGMFFIFGYIGIVALVYIQDAMSLM